MAILSKSLALLLVLAVASVTNIIGASSNSVTPTVWSNTFGGVGDEWAFSVIQTGDGGFAFAGYTTASGAGKADFWLVKTDAFGNQQWNRTFGGKEFDWASCVIQSSDGGYLLVGSTYTSKEMGYDIWIVKTDANGNEMWNRTFGGKYHDYAASVIETSEGGYAIAGIKDSFNDGGYSISVYRDLIVMGIADAWLIKTDSQGNEIWNNTFGGVSDDGAFCIVQTSDGGYALAGNSYSFTGGNNTDIWLVKTDSAGNMLWNNHFGGAKDDFGYFVTQTSDGGYAVGGITNSSGAGYEDVWLIKTDSNGREVWNRTYGGTLNDEAYCVMLMEDGGYAIAGSTFAFGAGLWDVWLIKTTPSGDLLWSQTYGGTGDDQAISMVKTDDGFVLSGATNSYGAGRWDAWIFKVSDVA
jgi:hypothetical protein